MVPRMPRTVDRSTVKIVAYKRTFTGVMSFVGAIALIVVTVRGHATALGFFGIAVFIFTGAWALRDGIRLLRELRR